MVTFDASSYIEFFQDYFSTKAVMEGIVLGAMVVVSLFALFKLSRRSQIRSVILNLIMAVSSSIWIFVLSSLAFCMALLQEYLRAPSSTVSLVAQLALVPSLALGPLATIVLRDRAAKQVYPFFRSGLPSLKNDSVTSNRVFGIFSRLVAQVSPSAIKLNVMPAVGGAPVSAALDWRGSRIVAITEDVAQLLDDDELESVIAHEIAHIKNRDAIQKTIATAYKIAFPFDPLARFIEAAIYREKELSADEYSARITKKPESLASALIKIHEASQTEGTGIGSPSFSSISLKKEPRNLFSKQPPLSQRVRRLLDLAEKLNGRR